MNKYREIRGWTVKPLTSKETVGLGPSVPTRRGRVPGNVAGTCSVPEPLVDYLLLLSPTH